MITPMKTLLLAVVVLTLDSRCRRFVGRCCADLRVTVPAGVDVTVEADSGDVTVTVPPGDYAVDAQTDSGDTSIDGIARDDRAPRSIQAQTDSGDVTLRGTANPPR